MTANIWQGWRLTGTSSGGNNTSEASLLYLFRLLLMLQCNTIRGKPYVLLCIHIQDWLVSLWYIGGESMPSSPSHIPPWLQMAVELSGFEDMNVFLLHHWGASIFLILRRHGHRKRQKGKKERLWDMEYLYWKRSPNKESWPQPKDHDQWH